MMKEEYLREANGTKGSNYIKEKLRKETEPYYNKEILDIIIY